MTAGVLVVLAAGDGGNATAGLLGLAALFFIVSALLGGKGGKK